MSSLSYFLCYKMGLFLRGNVLLDSYQWIRLFVSSQMGKGLSVRREVKPISGICVNYSKDKWLSSPEVERFWCCGLLPSGCLVFLRNWSLAFAAGRFALSSDSGYISLGEEELMLLSLWITHISAPIYLLIAQAQEYRGKNMDDILRIGHSAFLHYMLPGDIKYDTEICTFQLFPPGFPIHIRQILELLWLRHFSFQT